MGRLLAAALAALVFAAPARAFTKDDLRLPMSDGVDIAATLYLPDGPAPAGGWPAIIALHGLGQTRAASNVAAEAAFAPNGYAVLTVDSRGHGESGGLNDVDGPRAIQDVRELFAWLTARPDVDPQHVGAFGTSLGGGAVWRAAAEGVPFGAIVPVSAWTDLYRALYPGDLAKSGAVLGFLSEIPADHFAPVVTELRNDLLRSTSLDRVRALARERSSAHLLERVSAPALVVQGRRDFAFDLTEALAALRGLQGPTRLYLGDLGHPPATNPPAEVPHLLGLARAWFDRWLKLLPNGVDAGGRVELAPDPWTGSTYRYPGLPPTRSLRITLPGRKTIGPGGAVVRTVRLPRRLHETFGAPLVRVRASSASGWPYLVCTLTALEPGGKEVVVAAGGAKTPRVGRRQRPIAIRLTDQATRIPRGSRLRLRLATSSAGTSLYLPFPLPGTLKVGIGAIRLTLPVLKQPVSR